MYHLCIIFWKLVPAIASKSDNARQKSSTLPQGTDSKLFPSLTPVLHFTFISSSGVDD